jgi:hypothetical protein
MLRPDNGDMRNDQGSSREAAGIAVGVLGSIGVAGAMVGVRGEIANADVALILMVCVLAGAVIGGRLAGVLSALAAAMAFDFFHTKPYATLKIANKDDVITTVLLLAVGLLIGEVATWSQRLSDRLRDDRNEIKRMHRVAELAARGESTEDLVLIVTAELMSTMRLSECQFERPPFSTNLPSIDRNGVVHQSVHLYTRDGFELPREGVELPVLGGGRTLGRFVLTPTPGRGVTPERRLIAVALADQLGAALAWREVA